MSQDANYEWQKEGDPVYRVGDIFVMFLTKNRPDDDCWEPYSGANSVFDVVETSEEIYLYNSLGGVPCEGIPMTNEEMQVVTSTIENPAKYSKKLTLNNLLQTVESFGKEIDYSLEASETE